MLESYICLKSRRLEKLTGASFAQIGQLVKMLSILKLVYSACPFDITFPPFHVDVNVVNMNVEQCGTL